MRFASFKDCFSANPRIHDQTNKKQGLTAESGFWQLTLITNHSTEIHTTGLWIHAYKPEKRNAKKATNS